MSNNPYKKLNRSIIKKRQKQSMFYLIKYVLKRKCWLYIYIYIYIYTKREREGGGCKVSKGGCKECD